MTKRHDGGPAFPTIEGHHGFIGVNHPGKSLRDSFAEAALPAVITRFIGVADAKVYARMSYEIADAMLAARETEGALDE